MKLGYENIPFLRLNMQSRVMGLWKTMMMLVGVESDRVWFLPGTWHISWTQMRRNVLR